MKGFIVYPTYRVKDNKAFVHLYGRLKNGESFVCINECKPYFYVKESDAKKIKDHNIEKTNFKNFNDEPVAKVILDIPAEVPNLRKELEEQDIECYEADIRFVYRFMIDNDIKGTMEISGKSKKGEFVDRIYENPEIKPAEFKPVLKILSIDIETDMKAKQIYSISLYSPEYKEVLIVSDKKLANAKSFKDEKSMLEFFKKKIIELDPDIITGWNLLDFDLSVINKRFQEYDLDFSIGREDEPINIRILKSYWRDSYAKIPGRVALDGIQLLRTSFIKLEDYKLETAAQTFLGESKVHIFEEYNKGKEIERIYHEEPQKLVDYNLKDAELVYKILEAKGLIDLTVQRSLLTGMQLDRVKAAIASLDSLYIRETRKLGYVCNSSSYKERGARIKGGYVRDSIPGIYDYIDVLDFKSLYPSIIRTFNIDPLSYIHPDKKVNKEVIEAPNGAKFLAKDGILPLLIQRLWEQRDNAKKKDNKEESYAIKITMNSFFGVLANPMCRFYNLDIANAITHFGQHIVKTTADLVEKQGHKVIYGDTDSIFVKTETDGIKKAQKIGHNIQKYINDYWDKHVKKNYSKKSYLELQFEKVYIKFMMPKIRGSDRGSKKRYAGLIIKDGKERIDFTGLEFVRRDWTELSKKFQFELLDKVFHDKEVENYICKFIQQLKKGKYDDLLVYKKALRKRLSSYTKTTPPHVKAARLLDEVKSNIISYVITVDGPQPVEKLTSSINYDHYVEKQVKPVANSILVFLDKKFDDVLKGTHQQSLLKF